MSASLRLIGPKPVEERIDGRLGRFDNTVASPSIVAKEDENHFAEFEWFDGAAKFDRNVGRCAIENAESFDGLAVIFDGEKVGFVNMEIDEGEDLLHLPQASDGSGELGPFHGLLELVDPLLGLISRCLSQGLEFFVEGRELLWRETREPAKRAQEGGSFDLPASGGGLFFLGEGCLLFCRVDDGWRGRGGRSSCFPFSQSREFDRVDHGSEQEDHDHIEQRGQVKQSSFGVSHEALPCPARTRGMRSIGDLRASQGAFLFEDDEQFSITVDLFAEGIDVVADECRVEDSKDEDVEQGPESGADGDAEEE